MRCHNLPHQITLQTRGSTVDGHGQTVESWADTRTCRAKCEPLTGREWFAAGQLQGSISLCVTIRYFAGITSGMRLEQVAEQPPAPAAHTWQALWVALVLGAVMLGGGWWQRRYSFQAKLAFGA